jgi:pyruvate/2-oxoglutarate dehydrogenase complex dihydrolipoamide acyltransferase (E2) component
MITKITMPQLGESVVEGTVAKWLKKEGESISEYESLLEVDTDKVNSEIPSPASGTVLKIVVSEGTTVRAGTVLAYIGQPGEAIPEGEQPATGHGAPAVLSPAAPAASQSAAQAAPAQSRDLGFVSPVVARLAKDKNVDLYKVKGGGEGGRITKQDVLAYLEGLMVRPPEMPGVDTTATVPEAPAWETPGDGDLFRPTELTMAVEAPKPAAPPAPARAVPLEGKLIPHSVIRKRIAEHMVFSTHTAPHVTTVMEVEMSRISAHREANKPVYAQDGAHLTYTAYFVTAAAAALKAFPLVNSSWTDEGVLVHPAVNIGMAVSLGEEGLIVPVIKQADNLSLLGIVRAVNDLAARARSHRLKPEEVQGGTFSITNHGMSRSLFATPIINQPQAAILGVGAIQKRAVVINDAIAIRPMVYLSLTFDHRILDGDSADAFLGRIADVLEGWKK